MKFPRATIKDVKLVQEEETYYLDLTYECEDEKAVYVMNIPRVELPCFDDPHINVTNYDGVTDATIRFTGGVCIPIHEDENEVLFSKVVVERKTHKMTIAEIEEKLGYGIEIVSDK